MRYLNILLLFLISESLSAQNSIQNNHASDTDSFNKRLSVRELDRKFSSIDDYIELNREIQTEKVFLQTDRRYYTQGDTIWFKAYLWYGYEQTSDTLSGVLHVDLINSTGKIILKKRLLILNGSSNGDFSLDTIIKPGNYAIRAYTRMQHESNAGEPFYNPVSISPINKNFQFKCKPVILKQIRNDSLKVGVTFFETDQYGELKNNYNHLIKYSLKIGDHILTDSIIVQNKKEQILKFTLSGISKQDSVASLRFLIIDNRLNFEKQFNIPLQENIDLQFFPEGGNLVNGLVSKVAFKAIGTDGLSREVNGEIKTDDDIVVTDFKSIHKGMGAFKIKPLKHKQYFAHLWFNNQKYIVALPNVSENGTVMSVISSVKESEKFLVIKQTPSEKATEKYVVGSAYGKIWFSAILKSFIDSSSFKIPVELLPEGVCRLTILNEEFEPECERLIYNDRNQRFKIEVKTDSVSYAIRSKVTLFIRTSDIDMKPVQTDLSLSVAAIEPSTENSEVQGIKAYKLLISELKGYVEDADYYFKKDSSINIRYLDLLMLTQGYRKIIPLDPRTNTLYFTPENSMYVSGKIKFNGSKLHEKNLDYKGITLSLMSVSDKPYIGISNPDSLGNFRFQIPLMLGKQHLMLQATTAKNKPFNCDFILDVPAEMPKFSTLPSKYFETNSSATEYITLANPITKSSFSKIKVYGTMSKTLGEVTVTAKANPKNWWKNYDKDAVKIADLDSLDPGGDRYYDINDLLVKEFGAKWYNNASENMNTILMPCIRLMERGMNYWFPIYLVDGNLYWNGKNFDFSRLRALSAFPVDEIKRILVIPPGKSIIMNYAYPPIIGFPQFILQSMVIIETYSKNTYRGDIEGVKKFVINGLDVPREFYSPRYDGPARTNPEFDGRTTLYWNPAIYTDSDGQAKVDFFTGDRKATMNVVVNGIKIENGNPGEGKIQIKMKDEK